MPCSHHHTAQGITGTVEGYLQAAGLQTFVFDKVEANPTMSIVEAGVAMLRGEIGLEGTCVVRAYSDSGNTAQPLATTLCSLLTFLRRLTIRTPFQPLAPAILDPWQPPLGL